MLIQIDYHAVMDCLSFNFQVWEVVKTLGMVWKMLVKYGCKKSAVVHVINHLSPHSHSHLCQTSEM